MTVLLGTFLWVSAVNIKFSKMKLCIILLLNSAIHIHFYYFHTITLCYSTFKMSLYQNRENISCSQQLIVFIVTILFTKKPV